jgi:dipeptidyl aminopeptidase/acylaminoacyl peptidase
MQIPAYFQNEGQMIAGTLHIPDRGRRPVPGVVLCHGFTGNKCEAHFLFTKMSRALERKGIASLRFDFRGSGESAGEFSEMTVPREISDAVCAVRFLRACTGIDAKRVGILGLSLGGCVAACAAGRLRDLKGCALWAAVASPSELWAERARKGTHRPARQGDTDIGGLRLGAGFMKTLKQVRPCDSIKKARCPVLIVHGTKDSAVPFEHAERYRRAAASAGLPAKKVLIEDSEHVFPNLDYEQKVIGLTASWFADIFGHRAK